MISAPCHTLVFVTRNSVRQKADCWRDSVYWYCQVKLQNSCNSTIITTQWMHHTYSSLITTQN